MTYSFGSRSREKLAGVAPELAAIASRAIQRTPVDFTIVWGLRSKQIQDALFESGASHKRYPDSKHNANPSLALDFAPWVQRRIDWEDSHIFALIAGVMFACAQPGQLRWGGDWDGDGTTTDQTLMDWGHIELV